MFNIDPDQLLEETPDRVVRAMAMAVHSLVTAEVRRDRVAARAARLHLGEVMARMSAFGEMIGAGQMLEQAAQLMGAQRFAADRSKLVAFSAEEYFDVVPMEEAADDLVARTPETLKNAAERTAQRIAQLYSAGPNIAFVRAATETVTMQAQDYIQRAIREGMTAGQAGAGLAAAVNAVEDNTINWSWSYAKMAFRTNLNTAVTAGRFRQAQEPVIKAIIPAFRFDAVGDVDTRDNHRAADGIILRTDSVEWRKISPPLGYNCRCTIVAMTRSMLQRDNRLREDGSVIESKVPVGAFPDPGFRHGGRPDLAGVRA